MGFEEIKLNEKIIEKLKNRGIAEPTEIQRRTFPSAANGHDLIGISQTGSGKTFAFLLPIVQQILLSDKPFHALILVPTRELAQQIFDILSIFDGLNIRQALLSGGDNFNEQTNALNKKPHIVIGTPGRVAKHIEKTKNFHIERIRKLIFDEADRFFEQDFVQDLEIISKKLIKKNQTLMFTATLTDRCKDLANIFMRSPRIYSISENLVQIPTLLDSFAFIPEKYKLVVLYNHLQEYKHSSVIVFVGLCSTSQKVGLTLAKLGLPCEYLHGKLVQSKRMNTVKRFRNKEFSILISTDVASRGLDIPHVELVINFDLPDNSKIYTHRIGRQPEQAKKVLHFL
ncbi:ATP-dependent rRNA helicase RRP3 [Vittaforma corneae ATCC 50505]|uniref:ATP-dependent rRNA helicase RRP3 n=1 Tax=Vittaforma corneae (strain ATCC 50505) TaxID=993615 RepID=L2GQ12_VITCO|nr:ATP-dependent rRNA helicase RRP3 [Vittaforma corneae ATCC 50505]ELA42689.1 ATP-dependent rRNA helicase RRP3 [Vittaforma corneae ATCC 50505]